ncbi:hypothetical protein BUALT_Bualt01G0169400 [Buddleja alternifolia]|uniref:Uncharacterized protein n=1 Tax=Buddleja alternifolia TaxID=168488 RepID=A0AAV6YA52_9LAMI|nr:hypothetical protein BUALT_Bualt01G0169400 [Buddleja alternifolia]
MMLSMLPSEVRKFYSADTLYPVEVSDREQTLNPLELLHSIKVSGIPDHSLEIKEGGTYNASHKSQSIFEFVQRYNITVRLVRLVDICIHEHKIRILKMVFVDHKGFFMQGVVFGPNVDYFVEHLIEGSIYNVHDVQDIDSHMNLDDHVIDIFGLVVCVTCCRLTPDRSPIREIVLLDTIMTAVRMVLYGKFAIEEGESLLRTLDQNKIVLACGVVVKDIEGK